MCHATGTGQVSISALLQDTDFSFRSKYRKNWSRRRRYEYISSPCHSVDWVIIISALVFTRSFKDLVNTLCRGIVYDEGRSLSLRFLCDSLESQSTTGGRVSGEQVKQATISSERGKIS
jgi:hypothetical protein